MNTKRQKEVFDEFIKTNPMILCRTNKQVKAIQEFGYTNVSTVHQAKGLEYDNVIVVDTTIRNMEDLNIAYVALTRARDNMLVINWSNLEQMWLQERNKPSGFGWMI
jgi:superfamily I DNA/RNA helicase